MSDPRTCWCCQKAENGEHFVVCLPCLEKPKKLAEVYRCAAVGAHARLKIAAAALLIIRDKCVTGEDGHDVAREALAKIGGGE